MSATPVMAPRAAWRPLWPVLATWRPNGFVLAWLLVALAVSLIPIGLATCCAPGGHTGLGTVWFINDFAQYESAMAQGTRQPGWLIVDQLTAEPHQPALMFPLYVALGHLAGATGLSSGVLLAVVGVLARIGLVVALWRFARRFTPSAPAARAAFLLAVFGGGLGFLVTIGGQLLGFNSLYGGSFSYETNGFGLLFAAPHVPLAMAGTLELAGWLRAPARPRPLQLMAAALLGAGIALLHPFQLPVLLAALTLAGLAWWRAGAGIGTLLISAAASLGSLPVLLPTVATFSLDGFWSATYTRQNLLPSPAPHELFVDLGVTLILALGGAWFTRGRVAPFGLVLWALLALVAMYLPVPYQRRLAFGVQPAVAVMAGSSLVLLTGWLRPRAAAAVRLGVAALAASSTLLVTAGVISSLLSNGPLPVYRSTPDLDRAAVWLGSRVEPDQVILADWDTANYLAPRTPGRVIGGHPVATLEPGEKRFLIGTFFAHQGNLQVARALGAEWVVYGPSEADLARPAVSPAFSAGSVVVYRVPPAS